MVLVLLVFYEKFDGCKGVVKDFKKLVVEVLVVFLDEFWVCCFVE